MSRCWWLAAIALLACGRRSSAEKSHADASPAEAAEAKQPAEKEAHHDEIQLSPDAVRATRIELVEAARRPLISGLTATARITLAQKGQSRISPRVAGRVASMEARLGDPVKAGQVLAYIESPELGRARADYLGAVTRARVAEDNYKREKELLTKGITSEREAREAESAFAVANAERNAAETKLHAVGLSDAEIAALRPDEHYSSRFPLRTPIGGVVIEIFATLGQTVEAGAPLFTVGDLSEVWVLLDVFEGQLSQVHTRQPVTVRVDAYPDRVFTGRVDYVGDVVDERSRTIQVRVVVPNRDRLLKPGMFATAEIATTDRTDAGEEAAGVVVPRAAVQKIGGRNLVFVAEGENRFKAVEVRLGRTSVNDAEILQGLEPGTRVVTRGAFILKSELSKESLEAE
jgi:cobalt-zinc-cadmium efflux system membrane fusion protein